jgi:predicted permease
LSEIIDVGFLLVSNLVVILFAIMTFVVVSLLRLPTKKRGVFVQGSFRSNLAYIGLPVCYGVFGEINLPKVALFLTFVIPVHNLLAVLVLVLGPRGSFRIVAVRRALIKIVTNPLVIASAIGIAFSYFGIRIPNFLLYSIQPIGQAVLPLALLSIGVSVDLKAITEGFRITALASLLKLVVLPLVTLLIMRWLDIPFIETTIAVLMFSAPNAVVSYIMAREMGGDEVLALDVVMGTTLLSVLTISVWLMILL